MFGIGGFGRGARHRGGGFGGGLRSALLTGAGIMAWRWWKNRHANRESNPDPIGRDPRQSYDTGQEGQSGGSF